MTRLIFVRHGQSTANIDGYFAGHVIDEYIISIYLGVVAGIVTNFYRGEKIDEKTKT